MKKYAIVTGAYGAIGTAIVQKLAENKNILTTLVGRNEMKLEETIERIKKSAQNDNLDYKVVDLSRKLEIIEFADNWGNPLDILINNAGATPRNRIETSEGIEMQWATNVMGYFHMIKSLYNYMHGRTDPRIINVASYWAGGLHIDDPEFKSRHYNNDTAYRQSKQANRMLTVAFADLLKPKGITVVACHPGDVNSKLSNNLGYGGHESADMGADTPVWLATADEVKGITGKYFENRKLRKCQFSEDKYLIDRLFEICNTY